MAFIGDKLAELARQRPQTNALFCADDCLSRSSLAEEVSRVAGSVGRQVGQGKLVAVELANGPGFLVAFLGIARAGCRALVFDPAWPVSLRKKDY